jgi:hypothetical protein
MFYPQNTTKAQGTAEVPPITMYFKGQGLTTADPAAGNSTEEKVNCPGVTFGARYKGTIVGEWSFLPKSDFQIQGSFKASLWADSPQGAKNAGFRLNFYIGSNMVANMFSDRTDVSSAHKFTIASSVTAAAKGGIGVKAQLVWLSDPKYFIGPGSSGEFLFGSLEHASSITMTLAATPVNMSMTGAAKTQVKDSIQLNARFNDSLGMDPNSVTYEITLMGPATVLPEHISRPSVAPGDNGTVVSWLWNYKASKAQSGTYVATLTFEYSNDTSFSNSTSLDIRFVTVAKTDTFTALTTGGNLFLFVILIVVIALVAALVSIRVVRRRRRRRAKLAAEPEISQAEAA